MSDIEWIGRDLEDGEPRDAIGYVTSRADDCDAILVIVKNADGSYSTRAFGEYLMSDTMIIGGLLQYEGARQWMGDDKDDE